jgi:hypothetical protein
VPVTPDVPDDPAVPLVPDGVSANEAVVAKELDTAFRAQLLVPNNDPVIPLVTVSDPVMVLLSSESNPFCTTNSFAIWDTVCRCHLV